MGGVGLIAYPPKLYRIIKGKIMKLLGRDYDSFTGITEEYHWEEPIEPGAKGKLHITRLQDMDKTIDLNKAQHNTYAANAGYGDSNGVHHIARIPMILVEKWKREEGFDWFNSTDKERRARLMANPYLLTRPGKL